VAKVAHKEGIGKCVQEMYLKSTGKRTPRRPKRRWECNIKVDIKATGRTVWSELKQIQNMARERDW
jgi:hypothetical protein